MSEEDESDEFLFPYPTQDRNAQPEKTLSIQALNVTPKYRMNCYKMQKIETIISVCAQFSSVLPTCMVLNFNSLHVFNQSQEVSFVFFLN